jgi:acyl-CoA hydrolase
VEVVSEVEEKGAVKLLLRLTVWADPDGEQRRKALTGIFTFIATDDKFRPVRLRYRDESQG